MEKIKINKDIERCKKFFSFENLILIKLLNNLYLTSQETSWQEFTRCKNSSGNQGFAC